MLVEGREDMVEEREGKGWRKGNGRDGGEKGQRKIEEKEKKIERGRKCGWKLVEGEEKQRIQMKGEKGGDSCDRR